MYRIRHRRANVTSAAVAAAALSLLVPITAMAHEADAVATTTGGAAAAAATTTTASSSSSSSSSATMTPATMVPGAPAAPVLAHLHVHFSGVAATDASIKQHYHLWRIRAGVTTSIGHIDAANAGGMGSAHVDSKIDLVDGDGLIVSVQDSTPHTQPSANIVVRGTFRHGLAQLGTDDTSSMRPSFTIFVGAQTSHPADDFAGYTVVHPMAGADMANAYRWTRAGWQPVSLEIGATMYTIPFAGGYRIGWAGNSIVAITSDQLVIT